MNILDEDGGRAPLIGVFITDLVSHITDTITGAIVLTLSVGYISFHPGYVCFNARNREVFVTVDAGLEDGHACCTVDGDVATTFRWLTTIVCRIDCSTEAALTINRENALQTRKKKIGLVYRQRSLCYELLKLLCNYTGFTFVAYMALLGHKKINYLMLS